MNGPFRFARSAGSTLTRHTRRVGAIAWRAVQKFDETDGEQRAASFAYYAFFSMFPLILLLITIGTSFLGPKADASSKIIAYVSTQIPLEEQDMKAVISTINGVVQSRKSAGFIAIGVLFWTSLRFFQALVRAFWETDASLAEINPLILTGSGDVIALDAKINFDSNALFRHPELVALRDLDEEDPAEIEASKFDLAYIQLDGNIGCLVNGAGLAMATMDTIKLFGGEPANFLDVGGGATAEKVTEAFKIMLRNPGLKAILVNIFGGIMKCDTIAEGVITASRAVGLKVPLVVRMKGTNEELGRKLLADSGLPIISADSMAQAAEKVVAAAAAAH